eukprot:UN20183
MLRLLLKSKFGGIPEPEAYHKNTLDVDDLCRNELQIKISDLPWC